MPNRLIGPALAMTRAELGPAVVALEEDQWYERKSARTSPQAVANTICGMANAEGGTLVIGIGDAGVDGTDRHAGPLEEWKTAGQTLVEPPVRVTTSVKAADRADGTPDHILVLDIEPSPTLHATTADEVYLRVGGLTKRLSYPQRQELLYDKGLATFDASIVEGALSQDLDWELIRLYASAIGAPAYSETKVLTKQGLIKNEQVTAGGLLLFGEHPQATFPLALVRVMRYHGSDRETGTRQRLDADSDERIEGPIPKLLVEARERIRELVPARRALQPDGRFDRERLIPEEAWLEGLVNAVVHRSYSSADAIRVEIFDDRIDITSPGRFPGLVKLEAPLRVSRFARNPRIARVCSDLKWSQELGEGIRRMFDEMRTAGLLDPLYHQTESHVRLSLTTTPTKGLDLPPRSREVVEAVKQAGRLSTGEIGEMVGLSRPAVLKRLTALQNAGILERIGKGPNDPRAFWRLAAN